MTHCETVLLSVKCNAVNPRNASLTKQQKKMAMKSRRSLNWWLQQISKRYNLPMPNVNVIFSQIETQKSGVLYSHLHPFLTVICTGNYHALLLTWRPKKRLTLSAMDTLIRKNKNASFAVKNTDGEQSLICFSSQR